MYEVQVLIDKTYSYTSLKEIHNSLLLNNYTYMYNNLKYDNIIYKIYDLQLKKFNDYKKFFSFLEIIKILYISKNINDLTILIENNFDYIILLKNYKNINKIITIIIYFIQKSDNKDLIEKLYKIFYNECIIYNAKQNNKSLVCQNPSSIIRTIYGNSEKSVCLICLEEYGDEKVILCLNCNKYICHYICLTKMEKKKCLYCNSS
jgi:hypothetical protein